MTGQEIQLLLLSKKSILIGKDKKCEIVLIDNTIADQQLMLELIEEGKYRLTNLNPIHYCYVNEKLVSDPILIYSSDVLKIGKHCISISNGVSLKSNEVAIRVEKIQKTYEKKIALNNCSFEIPSNSLTAILGPSGCGKSTLLKLLCGDILIDDNKGKIHICGLELNSYNYEYLKTHIGYVPQDDIIHNELTVLQTIRFAARLKLPDLDSYNTEKKVELVLNKLGIFDIKDHFVAKISGGQRKRVSIAVEILTDPLILFLDEPTSPLDPQTIEEFLLILKRLANSGTSVIMVTHKPEDLNYMDYAIFMAEGGHMVYFGDANKYLEYFNENNPVKVYSKLAGKNSLEWIKKHKQIHFNTETNFYSNSLHHTSKTFAFYSNQYYWLTLRYFTIKINDPLNLLILISQAPIIALLICLIFPNITQSLPFFIAISAIWFGTNNAAREIVCENTIYKRERMFNQAIFPYLLSKITVLGILAIVQSIIFVCIIWFNFNGNTVEWNLPIKSIIWMSILSISATQLGLLLSAMVNTTEKVMSVIPIALIPQIMLAGVIVKINNSFVELLSYLTFSRWGTIGFSKIQEKVSVTNYKVDPSTIQINPETLQLVAQPKIIKSDTDTINNAFNTLTSNFHESYLNNFSKFKNELGVDIWAISALALIFFVATFLALKDKDTLEIYD